MAKFTSTTVTKVMPQGDGAVAVSVDAPFAWTPGQYVTLRESSLGDARRSYSIACQVGEPLTVGIRHVPGGLFSSFAQGLKAGDTLEIMPPEGRFVLHGEARVLMVAAGSGITPMVGMIARALEQGAEVALVYGNRTSASIMFKAELEALKDRYIAQFQMIHMLSREAQDVEALNGWIDLEKLVTGGLLGTDFEGAYLCGPGEMIDAASASLKALGFPAENIYSERFSSDGVQHASPAREPMPEGAKIEVILDGTRQGFVLDDTDLSVVTAAARAGMELPWSCKGGMCCTCRCRVLEGEAEMAVNYSLEQWEIDAGFTLACQARPTTDKLVLDFDAT